MKLVYATFPDDETASLISEQALDARIAACIMRLEGDSRYVWASNIRDEHEVIILFKTTAEKVDELVSFIDEQHPYDVPCILTIDADATDAYREWLEDTLH